MKGISCKPEIQIYALLNKSFHLWC